MKKTWMSMLGALCLSASLSACGDGSAAQAQSEHTANEDQDIVSDDALKLNFVRDMYREREQWPENNKEHPWRSRMPEEFRKIFNENESACGTLGYEPMYGDPELELMSVKSKDLRFSMTPEGWVLVTLPAKDENGNKTHTEAAYLLQCEGGRCLLVDFRPLPAQSLEDYVHECSTPIAVDVAPQ